MSYTDIRTKQQMATLLGVLTCVAVISVGATGLGLTAGDDVKCTGQTQVAKWFLGGSISVAAVWFVLLVYGGMVCQKYKAWKCSDFKSFFFPETKSGQIGWAVLGLALLVAMALGNVMLFNAKCTKTGETETVKTCETETIKGLDAVRIIGVVTLSVMSGAFGSMALSRVM